MVSRWSLPRCEKELMSEINRYNEEYHSSTHKSDQRSRERKREAARRSLQTFGRS